MPREATETYKKVAAMDPRNAWAQSGLGDVLVYEGRFSEAVPIFEQAAAADARTRRAPHSSSCRQGTRISSGDRMVRQQQPRTRRCN